MPGPQPTPLLVTPTQRAILEHLAQCRTGPHYLAQRARLLLLAADGLPNAAISRQLALSLPTVRLWRARWQAGSPTLPLPAAPDPPAAALREAIATLLADAPRPGAPPTFTAEQLVRIVALACEEPPAADRPISHWTTREVAAEAVQRGIVPAISVRSVARFLKSGRFTAAS